MRVACPAEHVSLNKRSIKTPVLDGIIFFNQLVNEMLRIKLDYYVLSSLLHDFQAWLGAASTPDVNNLYDGDVVSDWVGPKFKPRSCVLWAEVVFVERRACLEIKLFL